MESPTLYDLRTQKGLRLIDVLVHIQQEAPDSIHHRQGVKHIETRGTDKEPIIRGFAKALKMPYKEVAAAARATRKKYYEKVSKKSALFLQ